MNTKHKNRIANSALPLQGKIIIIFLLLSANIFAQTASKLIAIDAVQKIELKVNQSKAEAESKPIDEKAAIMNYLNQIDEISKEIHLKIDSYAGKFDISDIAAALKETEASFANIKHTSSSLSGIYTRLVAVDLKIQDWELWGRNLGRVDVDLDYENSKNNYNYIRTRTYTSSDGLQYLDQIQYFDGLGRPVELVQCKITPDNKDLASRVEYEGLSRKKFAYLPVKVEQNSGYYVEKTSLASAQSTMYNGD
ncbi:MAG: DUF6443 domain-containing protein, partial [Prevotellaceae bacterium]|nr:DUF6443 domain-containing protein [Prevotellaceae bacterium]